MQHLVQSFKEKGISTGVIKHHGHTEKLQLHEDKDTGILFHAGADMVIGNSPNNSEILMHKDLGAEAAIFFMQLQGVEQIIVEGYKNKPYPKIILLAKEADLILLSQLENMLGVCCTHGFVLPKQYKHVLSLDAGAWSEKLLIEYQMKKEAE